MNKLKYNFINDDHRNMHNLLIEKGWTCENDVKPPRSGAYWEWVYLLNNEFICFDNSSNRVIIHKDTSGKILHLHYEPFAKAVEILTLEKDLVVESREEQEYHTITKDNISDVLEYNEIYHVDVHTNSLSIHKVCSISMRSENWLQILEAAIGKKLKPLLVHKFDFVQYMLDNGFKKCQGIQLGMIKKDYTFIDGNYLSFDPVVIEHTEENAKIVLEIDKLMGKLK